MDIPITAKRREIRLRYILSGIRLANDHDEPTRGVSGMCLSDFGERKAERLPVGLWPDRRSLKADVGEGVARCLAP
ncbi:protein of unknown function [Methylocaldum szegediense]|uniref:Uncharacterized protein n=1 Tax=Methylocaldum szegediense TaxID=73780 RepID=A0ABM9I329_9GAMM|nr:protein of unknown function [Methylocaldum szegediense]